MASTFSPGLKPEQRQPGAHPPDDPRVRQFVERDLEVLLGEAAAAHEEPEEGTRIGVDELRHPQRPAEVPAQLAPRAPLIRSQLLQLPAFRGRRAHRLAGPSACQRGAAAGEPAWGASGPEGMGWAIPAPANGSTTRPASPASSRR